MYTVYWTLAILAASVFFLRVWPRYRRRSEAGRLARASAIFHLRREWLEADFVTLASRTGKPRGLDWGDCEFCDQVAFATDRTTRQLRAFVSVSVSFQAVQGGDVEDNPNGTNLRAATAVFMFDGRRWTTDGRAIFNLEPLEAIEHFQHELELVE
jgi:hypothetical protein